MLFQPESEITLPDSKNSQSGRNNMRKMLTKLPCYIILFICHNIAYGDLLYLKDIKDALEAKISSSNEDTLTAIIEKREITNITVDTSNKKTFPDTFTISSNTSKIFCKIVEMNSTRIIAKIPIHEVESFNIALSKQPEKINFIYDNSIDNEAETLFSTKQHDTTINKNVQRTSGLVTGLVHSKGLPLARCEIKLYKLEKSGVFFRKSYIQKETGYLETITNNDGVYSFNKIPEGAYKLYWRQSLGDEWKQRIEMEPDIIVRIGEKTFAGILDIDKGVMK